MGNGRWNPWQTGFWFFETRTGSYPVLYINRKVGSRTSTLNKCTKFREEGSAKNHPLYKDSNYCRLTFCSPLDPYLLRFLTLR